VAEYSNSMAQALLDGLANARINGQGSYSGERDYGGGFSGNNANIGGELTTEIPIEEYLLRLNASGGGGRWETTSPEELRQYGVPSRESGTYGAMGKLGASLEDDSGRKLGFEWSPGDNERYMLRGRIPF
jgi:hypothetical protein|tara:strand:- start:1619 stop:2008 length:390 start_codon:yes stop_codon:yes gene_type:complete